MSDIKIAPNTKFLSAFLASNIWQTNSVIGTQDNKTTEIVNKNVYNYSDWKQNEEPSLTGVTSTSATHTHTKQNKTKKPTRLPELYLSNRRK